MFIADWCRCFEWITSLSICELVEGYSHNAASASLRDALKEDADLQNFCGRGIFHFHTFKAQCRRFQMEPALAIRAAEGSVADWTWKEHFILPSSCLSINPDGSLKEKKMFLRWIIAVQDAMADAITYAECEGLYLR